MGLKAPYTAFAQQLMKLTAELERLSKNNDKLASSVGSLRVKVAEQKQAEPPHPQAPEPPQPPRDAV